MSQKHEKLLYNKDVSCWTNQCTEHASCDAQKYIFRGEKRFDKLTFLSHFYLLKQLIPKHTHSSKGKTTSFRRKPNIRNKSTLKISPIFAQRGTITIMHFQLLHFVCFLPIFALIIIINYILLFVLWNAGRFIKRICLSFVVMCEITCFSSAGSLNTNRTTEPTYRDVQWIQYLHLHSRPCLHILHS